MARSGSRLVIAAAGAVVLAAAGGLAAIATTRAKPGLMRKERLSSGSGEAAPERLQTVKRAIYADGRLWMLRDDGVLVSLGDREAKPRREKVPGRVLDICRSNGTPVAVFAMATDRWTVQRRSADAWRAEASVDTAGEPLLALACEDGSPDAVLVTGKRLVEVEGTSFHATPLKTAFDGLLGIGTALATRKTVWIGLNAGEWGGGLQRVDRADGTVVRVERNRSGRICGGPLNGDCDPVNALVVSPTDADCVWAAVGLVHMLSHGRIVEVCGTEVRRRYLKAFEYQPPRNQRDEGEPSNTEAFFGLARSDGTIWAVGTDGLYRFADTGSPTFRPLPTFENRGGYRVSFAVPGLVLVMTDVNQHLSLSGSVPIMAARCVTDASIRHGTASTLCGRRGVPKYSRRRFSTRSIRTGCHACRDHRGSRNRRWRYRHRPVRIAETMIRDVFRHARPRKVLYREHDNRPINGEDRTAAALLHIVAPVGMSEVGTAGPLLQDPVVDDPPFDPRDVVGRRWVEGVQGGMWVLLGCQSQESSQGDYSRSIRQRT